MRRIRMQVLKTEVTKAHEETQQIRVAKEYVDEELECTKETLARLQATHARLLSEWEAQGKRVQEVPPFCCMSTRRLHCGFVLTDTVCCTA